ncbi:unnamed protein product [Alopecurus aequalis]
MSALRCAARRLVGLRARAAVMSPAAQAQQRRLLPRLLHSGPRDQKELRKKKEELYNLLAKVELRPYLNINPEFDFIDRYQNRKLLQQLSVQIEPRHNDIDWRCFQFAHKMNSYRIYGTSIVTGYAFWHYALRGQNGSEDVEKEDSPGSD